MFSESHCAKQLHSQLRECDSTIADAQLHQARKPCKQNDTLLGMTVLCTTTLCCNMLCCTVPCYAVLCYAMHHLWEATLSVFVSLAITHEGEHDI